MVSSLGLDTTLLLQQAGLPRNALLSETADQYLSLAGLERLYTLAENQAQVFGLAARLGSQQEISALLGVIGFVMQQSKTIGEALAELQQYLSFQVHGAYLSVVIEDQNAALSFTITDAFRLPSTQHTVEFALSAAVAILRSLCGDHWKPDYIHLMHKEPKNAYLLKKYFHSPMYFDQEQNAVFFSASDLMLPISSANSQLNGILHNYLEQLEAEFSDDSVSQVEKLIRQALNSGSCNADKVASFMGIHRRTLHRLLKKEHTSFTELLDKVRQDLARKMLEQTHLSITMISESLCYAEPSAFSRAFKRWFNTTPQDYRVSSKD